LLHASPTLRAEDLVQAWAYVRAHPDEIDRNKRDNEAAQQPVARLLADENLPSDSRGIHPTRMSVDLGIECVRPLSLRPFLPRIAAVLTEMLGLEFEPQLNMDRLEEGSRLPEESGQVGIDGGPFLLISVSGEPDTVGVVGRADHLAVTIYGPRSNLQYALGASVAIALAQEFGGGIWDDAKAFGDQEHTTPDRLLKCMRVGGSHRTSISHGSRDRAAHRCPGQPRSPRVRRPAGLLSGRLHAEV
jgi:hypothetical protein